MSPSNDEKAVQDWEKELRAEHRCGRLKKWFPEHECDERISKEHATLKNLWEKAQPLCKPFEDVLQSIMNLEICNWNLEESIIDLRRSIGTRTSPKLNIRHAESITDDRWKSVWAFYITLKEWLPHGERSTGYKTLLKMCDPERKLQKHIVDMLGEPTELKQLYVQRFCANLEYWLGGFYPDGSPQLLAHKAQVKKLENEISKYESDSEILEWMRLDGKKGWIEICHHKAFRRFDIHISSIGAGTWRQDMPLHGIDGIERALTLEKFLFPIEKWIKDSLGLNDAPDQILAEKIWKLLGEKDDEKVFLASLLVSLLQSQQIAARCRAEKKMDAM